LNSPAKFNTISVPFTVKRVPVFCQNDAAGADIDALGSLAAGSIAFAVTILLFRFKL